VETKASTKLQLPHCSLSCESRMRSGLTLILSHCFAASRTSLLDLFIQLCAYLTAQATMGKLYLTTHFFELALGRYNIVSKIEINLSIDM
jgi:hypothetical protein